MSTRRYYNLPPAYITGKGKKLTGDFTDKLLNEMLYDLLGKPGVSAGKAQNSITANAGSSGMSGDSTSMYTAAQQDTYSGAGAGGTALGAGIGLIRDLIGYAHADKAAKVAYNRQNEFYDNHLSMAAKVDEYKEAGLNPMGLAGAGVGATSAPSVQQAETPQADAAVQVLGELLNYKAKMKQISVQEKGIDAQIEERIARAENIRKMNEWFDINQMASLKRVEADTNRLVAVAQTEEQKAALLFQQSVAQFIQNKYADEYNANMVALQQAELAYKESATAENYARIREINQHVQNMVLEGALTVAKTESMQATTKVLGIKADMLQFDKEHQRGNLIWQRVGQTISMVQGVTGSVANIFSCFTPLPKPVPKVSRVDRFDSEGVFAGRTEYGYDLY